MTGRRHSSWRGLNFQLFLILILPLTVLLLVITFGSLSLHQNAMRMLVGERDERAVRMAASSLNEQVRRRLDLVRGLAWRAEKSDADSLAAILASSDDLQADFNLGLAFLSPDGALLSFRGEDAFWQQIESAALPLLEQLNSQDNQRASVVKTVIYPLSQEAVVLALAKAYPSGWIAAGATRAASLAQETLVDAFSAGGQAAAAVVDSHGDLIYQLGSFLDAGNASNHAGVQEALDGQTGAAYLDTSQGEHVVAYSPVDSLGWALVVEEPWEMVSTPTLRATQLAPLVLVPLLLLALLALWFGLRQVVQPLQALEAKSARLAWGDFQAIQQPVGGILEVRRLQAELVHLAQKVQSSQKGLRGYIGAMTAAQEEERRRLARELHDDTIQALVALKQRVQLVQMDLSDEASARSMEELSTLTEQTIENLRRLTRDLRPIYLEDLGLVTALEMLARETGQATGIQVHFQKTGTERRLPPAIELAFYRIAQEALNNVARHAQASTVSLTFSFSPADTRLEISDDGKGFAVPKSPAEFAPGGHFGLLGLHERAELIGAVLKIDSAPGQGTHLKVTLPTKP